MIGVTCFGWAAGQAKFHQPIADLQGTSPRSPPRNGTSPPRTGSPPLDRTRWRNFHVNQKGKGRVQMARRLSRWWFERFFNFTPILVEMIQFHEHIFQMGWFNHHSQELATRKISWDPKGSRIVSQPPIFQRLCSLVSGRVYWVHSLKLTFSDLKMDGWTTHFLLGFSLFSAENLLLVWGSVRPFCLAN